MSPFLVFAIGFVALGAGSTVLLRRSVRRGEEFFALFSLGVVLAVCIYLGAHTLLAFTRAI